MNRWRRLAALLLALCMVLGLAACAVSEEDAALVEALITEALEPEEDGAPDKSPAEELVLVQEPEEAPGEAEAPAPEEAMPEEEAAPEEDDAPAEDAAPDQTPVPPDLTLPEEDNAGVAGVPGLDPDGEYTSKEDVALYLHLYGELPKNFITKNEARDLGWSGGGLDGYADGMCIGGDRFGNYEGLLPPGSYHECDIDTLHAKSRGAKRLIYSDDGRIYYTDDHYESFTLLYGEE